MRREGGGRGRRRRRAHRGGGGGFSPVAASGSSTAGPAFPAVRRAAWSWSRRRRRDRGGSSGSLYFGPISPARGAGGAAAAGAPGRLRWADGASWLELAGGRAAGKRPGLARLRPALRSPAPASPAGSQLK